MRKPIDLPYAVEDKFLQLDRLTCNGIMYDDMNDPETRREFEANDGKYAYNNGLTAVIIGDQIYVTPFTGVSEILEAYGFEKGNFTVRFSVDIYEDYRHAMGHDTIVKVASHNLEDPVYALANAQAQIFQSMKFRKWNELLKQAKGLDLEQFHRKVFRDSYVGPQNAERREARNRGLREMIKEYYPDNESIIARIDSIEASKQETRGRRR